MKSAVCGWWRHLRCGEKRGRLGGRRRRCREGSLALLGSGVKDIIMSHWVGGVDQMPDWSFSIYLESKRGLKMDADTPQSCGDNDLLLTSPNTVVKSFFDVAGVGVMRILRPKSTPQSLGGGCWRVLVACVRRLCDSTSQGHDRDNVRHPASEQWVLGWKPPLCGSTESGTCRRCGGGRNRPHEKERCPL